MFELLSEGRQIADQLGEELAAVLVGKDVAGLVDSLGEYGADKVYLVESDALENYTTDGGRRLDFPQLPGGPNR